MAIPCVLIATIHMETMMDGRLAKCHDVSGRRCGEARVLLS